MLQHITKSGMKRDRPNWTQLVTYRQGSYDKALSLLTSYVPEIVDGGGLADHKTGERIIFIKHNSPDTVEAVKLMLMADGLSVRGNKFW